MSLRAIIGVLLIALTLLVTWKEQFIKLILVAIVILIFLYIIRKLADLYWYGKEKGEW